MLRHGCKLLAMLVLLSPVAGPIPEAGAIPEQHCVVTVLGRAPDGMFITTPEQCYLTFPEAMASSGASTAATFALAIHYDGFSGSGSTLTVNGENCTGGWLNLSSTWINRISSTRNGCPRIRHFDGNNLSGGMEETYTAGAITNLTALNNASNSIQYLS